MKNAGSKYISVRKLKIFSKTKDLNEIIINIVEFLKSVPQDHLLNAIKVYL
jgi:hypothetical protein